jgi:hypothetical protein
MSNNKTPKSKPSDNSVEINIDVLPFLAASHFASKDQTRFTLCGVRLTVEKKEAIIMATDGRAAFACRVQLEAESVPFAVTLPVSLFNGFAKIARGKSPLSKMVNLRVGTGGDCRRLYLCDALGNFGNIGKEVGGEFPTKWRQVFPKGKLDPCSSLVNWNLVRKAVLAAEMDGKEGE